MEQRVAMPEEPTAAADPAPTEESAARDASAAPAPPQRRRVIAYDILRVFAAITVVSIHICAPFIKTAGPFNPMNWFSLFDQGLHYAVPMFTFFSGVLSWGVVWVGGPGVYANFMRRRLLVVGVPYLAWCTIFYFLRPLADQGQIPHNPLALVRDFVELTISGKMWYHLYFVPMILVLYLLTPLASKAARKAPELFLAVSLVGIVYGGPWLIDLIPHLPGHRTLQRVAVPVLVALTTYGPFMVVGAWFGVRRAVLERALRWASAPLLGAAVAVLVLQTKYPVISGALREGTWVYILDMSLFVLGFLGVAFVAADRRFFAEGSVLAKHTVALAAATLGVYLVHPLVITFGERKLVGALGLGWTWHYLGFAFMYGVIAVVVCFAVALTFKRFKPTRHLA
jgi:surface polysaccharide O-acyltransferase-like enzyme